MDRLGVNEMGISRGRRQESQAHIDSLKQDSHGSEDRTVSAPYSLMLEGGGKLIHLVAIAHFDAAQANRFPRLCPSTAPLDLFFA